MANRKAIPQEKENEIPRLVAELGSPQAVADHLQVSRSTIRNWLIANGWYSAKVRHSLWIKDEQR